MSIKTVWARLVDVKPFTTPNFLVPVGSDGDGFDSIPLQEADSDALSLLCDQFRADVFAKAGKADPRLKP